MMADKPKTTDEISFGPELEPGVRIARRRRDGETRDVLVTAAGDGVPIQPGSELATFEQQGQCDEDGTRWHTITSSYRHGPAQVATPKYREGYDRIFGKKQPVGQA